MSRPPRPRSLRAGLLGAIGTVLLLVPALAARPFITVGPSDGIALDQPRVSVGFFDGSGTSLGPATFNGFLLDTGAERIVVAGGALSELESQGYATDGTLLEQGVGGFSRFDVSLPYRLDFTGDAGDLVSLTGVRAISSPSADYGSFGGIVGMPGMVGRVASIDLTPLAGLELIDVAMADTLPADAGHHYTVPLERVAFPIEEPTPPTTASGVPFLTAIVEGPVHRRRGRFLLDTGAQASMISEHLAFDLGLDTDGDGNFDNEASGFTEVGGVGGTISVPTLDVGTISLPTAQGIDLRWTDVSVLVLEVHPQIDGVFGSDLLTSGWLDALFGGADGYFQRYHLDFRESALQQGTLVLDLTPALDTPAPGLPPSDLDDDGIDDDWEPLFAAGGNAPWSDDDGDGLALVLEHALNTSPDRFDTHPLEWVRRPDGSILLSYPRNRHLPFTGLRLESSTTLAPGSWTPVDDGTSTVRLFDGLTERVTTTLPAPAAAATYYRLSSVPPPAE